MISHDQQHSFNLTLLSLTRSRSFPTALHLIYSNPNLLSPKSLSIFLTHYLKFHPFDHTLQLFDEMPHRIHPFGTDEFNALLYSFCVRKRMLDARAVFRKLHYKFGADTKTMNILLMGFKESGSISAVEQFYHEMIMRGFCPNVVTFNIRVDAYCKKGRLADAVRVVEEEMGRMEVEPNLVTLTTLVHGACIVRDVARAREFFAEIGRRGLVPDVCSYNALLSALVRGKELAGAIDVMGEMEEKGVGHDDATYYAVLWGMKRYGSLEDVRVVFKKMVERGLVPKVRTMVMLMKYFCEKRRLDLGLELWSYMVDNGCCPHGHALDLLVTALCNAGRVGEACQCLEQVVDMRRYPSERVFRILEGFLLQDGGEEKIKVIEGKIKRLQQLMPPSKGHALYSDTVAEDAPIANSSNVNTLML